MSDLKLARLVSDQIRNESFGGKTMYHMNKILPAIVAALLVSVSAIAQTSTPVPGKLNGSLSAGLAMTGGNTDTSNLNIALVLIRDLKTKNVIKANGLYLRGAQNDDLIVNRTSANIRDEYTVSGRTFVFGQMDYVRDRFKDIDYLFAPTAGAGYKILTKDTALLLVDGGVGGLWEKNRDLPVKQSGSVTAGQRFSSKVSSTVTLTQSLATLWKTNDFGDSLSNFSAGVTSSINRQFDLKVEFLDSYKSKTSRVGIKKNDTAFVTALVVKF
jgi:putative salt-induced outer membrane protein YdiY